MDFRDHRTSTPATSEGRFQARVEDWRFAYGEHPGMDAPPRTRFLGDAFHALHWLGHNVVVHPFLGVTVAAKWVAIDKLAGLPHPVAAHALRTVAEDLSRLALDLHDLSSKHLNRLFHYPRSPVPSGNTSRAKAWLVHNVLAHVAIGLLPCEATFAWHDETARDMGIRGWVLCPATSAAPTAIGARAR